MTLHVLTAVTRPENLAKIGVSLSAWGDTDFDWRLRYDLRRRSVGGQAVKNALLETVADGWVYFLDDDTIAHPLLYRRTLGQWSDAAAFVVSQQHSILGVLHAAPENVVVGGIDIGQAIVRRDVIGDARIPLSYAGDGEFLAAVLGERDDVVFLDEILSVHNALAEPSPPATAARG